jgi:hypothetical protein
MTTLLAALGLMARERVIVARSLIHQPCALDSRNAQDWRHALAMTYHKCGAGGLSEGAEQVRAHAGDVTNVVTNIVCSQKQMLLRLCH